MTPPNAKPKKSKRQVWVVGALYVKDANRSMKCRHDGDLMKIHTEYVRGEGQPEEEEAATEP